MAEPGSVVAGWAVYANCSSGAAGVPSPSPYHVSASAVRQVSRVVFVSAIWNVPEVMQEELYMI